MKGGRCVRLFQGDYDRETVFSDDPVAMAVHWASLGAKRLHVVDLDGAAEGRICHDDAIAGILSLAHVPVQVGGGVRDMQTFRGLLERGVQRVVLGTAAVEDRRFVAEAIAFSEQAVIVSIDARDGFASTRGWKAPTMVRATDLAREMVSIGVKRLIYTDIMSDGTMGQPDYAALEQLMEHVDVPVIAAGGISSPAHLVRLKTMGLEGAIVGRALYDGKVKLQTAQAELDCPESSPMRPEVT